MYFSNIYGQFKIAADHLAGLEEQSAQAIREAALRVRGDWEEDTSGNLHSRLIQLRLPRTVNGNGSVEESLDFLWSDAPTRAAAFRAVSPQLLVFDVHGASPRGDTQLRLSGHASETSGRPLYLFKNVPRPLALKVSHDVVADLQRFRSSAAVLAYRLILPGQSVRTLELLATYSPRKRQLEKIKWIQVYDHSLIRKGDKVLHELTLRALYDTDNPGRQRYETTLGSSEMTDLLLHTLSAHASGFYGEAGNAELAERPAPTGRARELFKRFRPAESSPQLLQKEEGSPQRNGKKKSPSPLPPKGPDPAPPAQVMKAPEPEEVPSELPAGETPTVQDSPITGPPAPDPWVALSEQMVVDDAVLKKARAALERGRPLLLRGAPGTGKTMLARALAEALCGPGNFTLVTADARWTSADVIGGLRVAPGAGLQYVFSPGVVTRAALRHATSMAQSGRPHALIIDEFNRANQDEAFGRLLTLLDGAYRPVMPLVSVEDGAPEEIYLPSDFLLIATMNDADMARLHEIGAALSRRFASVPVGIPRQERTFLTGRISTDEIPELDALYAFVGTGEHANDQEHGYLRAFVPVGTYFMREALEMLRQGLSLDEALGQLTEPLLPGLSRDALTALLGQSRQGQLPQLSAVLEETLARTHF